MTNISQDISDLLHRKFNIIARWNFLEFDHDFKILRSYIDSIKKNEYDARDRIIVEHTDTDYYINVNGCPVGINLRNFFGVINELDIPNYLFIFYTTHFGITKEIDALCRDKSLFDRPTVIETLPFFDEVHYNKKQDINDIDCDIDSIKFNMLCMMHLTRSHRNAVYRQLDKIDKSKILLSGTNANF